MACAEVAIRWTDYNGIDNENISRPSFPELQDEDGLDKGVHYYARNGCVDEIHRLANIGADLDELDDKGCTPLMLALENKHTKVAEILIENEADVKVENSKGMTALHYAALYGDVNITNMILQAGAYINKMIRNTGRTPLMLALENKKTEVAERLIKKGANVKVEDCDQLTALHYAAKYGDEKITLILTYDREEITKRIKYTGRTPLMLALKNKHTEVAEILMRNGADVNDEDEDGMTALYYASIYCDGKISKMILEAGAEINKKYGPTHETPLMLALENKHTVVAEILIEKGADCNIENWMGKTALHYAAMYGDAKIIDMLLKAGSDIDKSTVNTGYTPLMLAMVHKQIEVAEILIEKGADVKVEDFEGMIAIHFAALYGDAKIIDMLLKAGSDIDKSTVDTGRTPLILAMEHKQIEVAEMLIEKGADVNIEDCEGITAVHYADRCDNQKINELLRCCPPITSGIVCDIISDYRLPNHPYSEDGFDQISLPNDKEKIKRNYADIIELGSKSIRDVVDRMYLKNEISCDEKQIILTQTTLKDKTRKLLTLLLQKEYVIWVGVFMKYLSEVDKYLYGMVVNTNIKVDQSALRPWNDVQGYNGIEKDVVLKEQIRQNLFYLIDEIQSKPIPGDFLRVFSTPEFDYIMCEDNQWAKVTKALLCLLARKHTGWVYAMIELLREQHGNQCLIDVFGTDQF